MVTASQGYSLHDTKHKIRRLDSVFHHLALDEVMIPWVQMVKAAAVMIKARGLLFPMETVTLQKQLKTRSLVSMIQMIVFLKMNRVNVWICLHECYLYFVQGIKFRVSYMLP